MNFYTNVQLVGNTILYRGYEGGEKVTHRDSFSPTLFVSSKKKSKYTTLDGKYVKPIKFDSVRDARDFTKKYDDIDEFEVLGYERFLYQLAVPLNKQSLMLILIFLAKRILH